MACPVNLSMDEKAPRVWELGFQFLWVGGGVELQTYGLVFVFCLMEDFSKDTDKYVLWNSTSFCWQTLPPVSLPTFFFS